MQRSYLNTEDTVKAEHEKVVCFLKQKKFIEKAVVGRHWNSTRREKAAIELINRLYESTGEQLTPFSIDMGYTLSNGTKIINVLNSLLKQRCKNEYHVDPPIKIFSQSLFSKEIFCHFVCAEDEKSLKNKKKYPIDIVTLKEAKARGELKARATSQKAEQPQTAFTYIKPEETLKLQKKVIKVDKNKKNQNLFRFEYCWPVFVGRDEEMQRLHKFVNYENENLLWWTITGNGGTGKSRLALELCCQLKKQGWYAGFLTNTNGVDAWRKWEPQRPTLIVVDYTHEKAKELGEHIGNKYEESKQWKHPVRILFLERTEESEALREFCCQHREIFENNIRYNEINDDKENKSLKLKGLGDEFIDLIIAGVFERYSNKRPSTDEVKMIKNSLKGKGHENRPLYAMFVADACARGEDVRGWDVQKLHKSVLEHNKNIWKRAGINETNDLDKKHINLLTLATMTNGIDICSTKYSNCLDEAHGRLNALTILPAEHEFRNDKYKILCDDEIIKELNPMTPDILGEYFVLKRWEGDMAEACEMELLMKIAWQYKPWGIIDFITRAAKDFQIDERLDRVIELIEVEEEYYRERAILLFNLSKSYGKARKFDKAVKYYERIKDLWNSGYQKDKEISLVLATAAYNQICSYGAARELDNAAIDYEYLKDLWNSGYQKDKEISLRLADAAVNLTQYYSDAKELNNAAGYYEHLKDLWNSGYQKDKEISLGIADAAYQLTCCYAKTGKFVKAVKCYNRIKDLWNSGYQKDKEITLVLTKAAVRLTYCYAKTGEFDKAVKCYNRIKDLWNSGYQKDKEFSLNLADAVYNLTIMYCKAGELDNAAGYYECLEDLWNSGYQKDKKISFSVVNAAVSLTCHYTETGELDKAVKYYERIEKLWDSGYQKDKEFSLDLANAAASLTYGYAKTEELDKAVKYYERLKNLWNSGYQKDKDISLRLTSAARKLTYHYAKTKEFDKAVYVYNCIKDLWNSGYQKDKKISLNLADAVYNLTIIYCEARELNNADRYYECLEDLWNSGYQKNKIISLRLADAAYKLTCCYAKTGKFVKAVKCYNRIKDLWNSGYQKDKEISLDLTNAAVVCSVIFDEKGETIMSEQYEKKIMELYKSFPGSKEIAALYKEYFAEKKGPRNNLWAKIEGIAFGEVV